MPSLVDHAAERLATLAARLELDPNAVVGTFRDVVGPWVRSAPVGWRSEISDDHTPIELSVTLDEDVVGLRVLFEAQATEARLAAFRQAALGFFASLEPDFGADLSRLRRVEDLFLPEGMQGSFAAWSSVVFERGQRPTFKAYLNPQSQGIGSTSALVEEALARLGLGHAFAHLCAAGTRRGPHLDEIKYFALDLTSGPHARVKVYVHHHAATAEDLDEACARSRDHRSGDVLPFLRAMRGSDEPMLARAPFTCHAFSGERGPATTTVYVPVCAYAASDAEVERRTASYLEGRGVDPTRYRRILAAAASRPLEDGVGLQSWLALRRQAARLRLTIYLATEARHVYAPGTVPAPSADRLAFSSSQAVLARIAELPVADHPLTRRLLDGAPRHVVWTLLHALREGLSRAPLRHHAAATTLLDALDAASPSPPSDLALVAGRRLAAVLADISGQVTSRSNETLAALADALAEQLVRIAADVLSQRPGREAPRGREEIILRDESNAAPFARAALAVHRAFWNLLDELYVAAFRENA